MRESFSRPSNDQEVRRQIAYGIEEYLQNKINSNETPELRREKFFVENSSNPQERIEFERRVGDFVLSNVDLVVDAILTDSLDSRFDQFGVLNEDLNNFGFDEVSIIVQQIVDGYKEDVNRFRDEETWNYEYRDELKNSGKTFSYDELQYNTGLSVSYSGLRTYDNYKKHSSLAEYIAVAYLKENIVIDSKSDIGVHNAPYNRRFYDKQSQSYLGKNDFGMKPYGGEANVEDIEPYAQSVKRKVRAMLSNIESLKDIVDRNYGDSASAEDIKSFIKKEEVLDILQNAVPYRKFINEAVSKNQHRINAYVESSGIEASDLYAKRDFILTSDFRNGVVGAVLSNIQEFPGGVDNVYIANSEGHGKPIILNSHELDELGGVLQESAQHAVESKIVKSYPDQDVQNITFGVDSGRGEGSPYSFHYYSLFDAVKKIGADKFYELYPYAKETIDNEQTFINLNMNEFIDEINDLDSVFGGQLSDMSKDQINKERWHARALNKSNVWDYFASRAIGLEKPEYPGHTNDEEYQEYQSKSAEYSQAVKDFFDNLSQREKRNLFYEGKKMYWLTKQIRSRVYDLENRRSANLQRGDHEEYEEEDEGFNFYYEHYYIDWKQYDPKGVDTDKLFEYFKSHGNIICTLLSKEDGSGGRSRNIDSGINIRTIMQIIDAMEAGADMRGVALAYDKEKYIEGVLSGNEEKNDIEFALRDWPAGLRQNVLQEEFDMYYEHAEEYLYQDPKGMLRYAQLMVEEPNLRDLFGNTLERKSDLDLRLCLAVQTPEVRAWYEEGALYVGHQALQRYFVRFNATREQVRGYPNLHDALYWIPSIKKVTPNEAYALLADIQTIDESNEFRDFLQRYDKERDPLKESEESIKSLRDLKKRVFALEANIDLTQMPPQLLDIISAPGFNLSALKNMQGNANFEELLEGKLDGEQPFKPYTKKYTEKPLHEALSSGLGSFRKKIRGTAQSPKKLFADVRKLMQGREIEGRKMQIQDLLKEIPKDMEDDILKLLQDQRVQTGAIVEAKLHDKSDSEGWVCGNYTDCCMPFGASNNNDYMFNKGTQYFTIKYNNRIIAQSVVVDSVDSRSNEDVIVLDNIEVANNYKNRSALLSHAYKNFWSEYTSKKVKIGTGYSDLIPEGAQLENNNYKSKYSLSYSDATGPKVYNLPKVDGIESVDKVITFANLTERDVKVIAEMEKQVYPENMAQGEDPVREIIRKQKELDLPGAASSFILRQGSEPAGYLLVLPGKSKLDSSEDVAHIHDMAVVPEYQGGKIAKKMMERMLETALAYGVPAIEFEARESTSYRLITHPRIAKWIEDRGFKLTYNEKLPEYLGGEDFYYVRLEKIEFEE